MGSHRGCDGHSARHAKTLYLATPISIENDLIYGLTNASADSGPFQILSFYRIIEIY